MTTLIGIVGYSKNEPKTPSVVLASDLQGTISSWDDHGDVSIRKQLREESDKIWVDKERNCAITMAGPFDSAYQEFLYAFTQGEFNMKEFTDKKYFPQLLDLNVQRFKGKSFDGSRANTLLLATRFEGKPQLFGCYPLGYVEELPFGTIGSGSELAREYFARQNILSPKQVTVTDAITHAAGAIYAANKDIYTSGLNLAVINAEGVHFFGEDIKRQVKSAEQQAIEKIKRKFA